MMLGDLGADVIKVESPGHGDDTRQWGPPFAAGGESAYFLCVNRNKRSMTLNLKSDGGKEILRKLIATGDVLIENFKVGTLENWSFTYQELQRIRPGLIYATITGYGYTGPYTERAGYDFPIQAQGGIMSITGPSQGEPYKVGVAIADITAGMFACNAIMAALFKRERTGEGQRIDISLLDSQIAWLANVASNYLISGEEPVRFGNAHPNIVPYQVFRARDTYFALAVGNDLQWAKFCQILHRAEWINDSHFATNASRVGNREILIPLLEQILAGQEAGYWLAKCEEAGIPAAPINTVRDILNDPHVRSRGMLAHMEHPTAGMISLVGSPMRIPTNPTSMRKPPPLLGQHTREILHDLLGYPEDQINRLGKEVGIY
jgi:formyl-CoA transferase